MGPVATAMRRTARHDGPRQDHHKPLRSDCRQDGPHPGRVRRHAAGIRLQRSHFPSQLRRSPAARASWKSSKRTTSSSPSTAITMSTIPTQPGRADLASRQGATTLSAKRRHLRRFRCPYLRWNEDTIARLSRSRLLIRQQSRPRVGCRQQLETETYRQVLQFTGRSGQDYPPCRASLSGGSVAHPCLPDDESLIDRFHLLHLTSRSPTPGWRSWTKPTAWASCSRSACAERIRLCKTWLTHTLRRARTMSPHVWITRLDEAARWWRARLDARIAITPQDGAISRLQTGGRKV